MRAIARHTLQFVLFALTVAAFPAQALEAGKDYTRLARPQPVETGAKVEVLEFFWYGCGHCYDLEPAIAAWSKKLPKDVAFRQAPSIPSPRWAPLAQTYFTLEAMGELARLNVKVFDAIHLQNVNLNDPAVQLDWMVKQGVDKKRFSETWGSFTVQSKMSRGVQITEAYQANSVPVVIVDGKYQTSLSLAGSQERLFVILDELIKKARAERGK